MVSSTDRVKRALLALRRSRPGKRCGVSVLVAHSRVAGRSRRVGGVLHQMALYDPVTPTDRNRSVENLVELFFTLVADLEVERFVEAGAKEAAASHRASSIDAVREIVAFEANPYTHRRFAPNHENSSVRYKHLALSDRPGTATLFVRLRGDGSPSADGQASLLVRPSHQPGFEEVEVEAVTLDGWFGAPTGHRTALWIDVEGASSAVLGGASSLLGETDVLIVEVEERVTWEGQQWLRNDVIAVLATHDMIPIARDQQSRYQFNILFVRDARRDEVVVRRALATWRQAARR